MFSGLVSVFHHSFYTTKPLYITIHQFFVDSPPLGHVRSIVVLLSRAFHLIRQFIYYSLHYHILLQISAVLTLSSRLIYRHLLKMSNSTVRILPLLQFVSGHISAPQTTMFSIILWKVLFSVS